MSKSIAILDDAIQRVTGAAPPADPGAVQAHLDALTKPPGSLGRLEELARQVGCVLGDPPSLDNAVVFVFAADHGVTARGVSAYPAEVTAQMCANFSAAAFSARVAAWWQDLEPGSHFLMAHAGVVYCLDVIAGGLAWEQTPEQRLDFLEARQFARAAPRTPSGVLDAPTILVIVQSSGSMEMSNVKQEAQHLVDSLPDNATWDDLMYTIYVRQAIESGLEDSDAGRVLDVGEVRARFGLSA